MDCPTSPPQPVPWSFPSLWRAARSWLIDFARPAGIRGIEPTQWRLTRLKGSIDVWWKTHENMFKPTNFDCNSTSYTCYFTLLEPTHCWTLMILLRWPSFFGKPEITLVSPCRRCPASRAKIRISDAWRGPRAGGSRGSDSLSSFANSKPIETRAAHVPFGWEKL